MGLVLSGGSVASAGGVYAADVRLEGGVITDVALDTVRAGDEVVDAKGKYILPGGIDVHTHFDLPLGDGRRTADDFLSGTRAAIAGGTTTIIDYATQFKGETLSQGLANWHELARGRCFCDYSFHLAITDWQEKLVADLPEILAAGVTSFKMYMAYKGSLQVDDGVIFRALKRLRDLGGLLCVHCENGDNIAAICESLLEYGMTEPEFHAVSRPEELEAEAVGRLLVTARMAEAPVYIVHLSTNDGMRKILDAKMCRQRVFTETCPQYLYLDDSLYSEGAPGSYEAAKYVCSPPLRNRHNQIGLWSALDGGMIDVVATDHCSFNFKGQKDLYGDDFTRIPNGMPGVETRMLLLYDAAANGRISLPQMVRVASTNPARIFGMYPRKGAIVPGADADVVVLDPGRRTVICAARQHQNVDYTPYEGYHVPAAIESVYLRGERVYHDGAFASDGPAGQFIARSESGTEGV